MDNDRSASKARINFFKLILLVAGIAVALYLALNRVKFQNKAAAPKTATLSLSSSPTSVNVGQNFTVTVTLNTGGAAIRGGDIRMSYDKTKVSPTAITTTATGTTLNTFAPITANNTFDSAKVITSAGTNCSGNTCYLEFGAVTANLTGPAPTPTGVTNAYNGTTSLALVTFTALTTGTANINLESTSNLTTDSNVVADINPPEDILSSVTNTSVTIASSTVSPTPAWNKSDVNGSGAVDIFDYNAVVTNFGCPGRTSPTCATNWNIADIVTNNQVDIFDYNALITNFGCPGRTSPVCS